MPSRTLLQHKAMAAAADGKSTLGIPKKVGEEFVKSDKGSPSTSGGAGGRWGGGGSVLTGYTKAKKNKAFRLKAAKKVRELSG